MTFSDMSPVSCLVRVASTERRKKRVRFSDDVTPPPASEDCVLSPSPDRPTADLKRSLPPALTPAESPTSSPASPGSLTPCATHADAWSVSGSFVPSTWTVPDLPSPCTVPEADSARHATWPAWWNRKVSLLGVAAPLTVLPSVPCQDAVDIMHREGFDQLPVVDQPGEVLGIVNLESLMTALVIRRVQPSSPVETVMCRQFYTVSRDETLGSLARILKQSQCALIVHSQRRLTENREVATKEVVIGIVTQIDLLAHIISSDSLSM